MDRFEFFKEQYYKEHERRSEINNTLTSLIGYITGIVAVLYYFLTTFEYKFNWMDTAALALTTAIVLMFLSRSMYHLIKAYTNLHHGYDSDYLADASELHKYYGDLEGYYKKLSKIGNQAENDFAENILTRLVAATDANQKGNKLKSFHRHMSQRFLVFAFAFLILDIVPYAINYGLADKPLQDTSVRFTAPLVIHCDSSCNESQPDTVYLSVCVRDTLPDMGEPPRAPENQNQK